MSLLAVENLRVSFASETGPVTAQMRAALLAIQTGQSVDTHGWLYPISPV